MQKFMMLQQLTQQQQQQQVHLQQALSSRLWVGSLNYDLTEVRG